MIKLVMLAVMPFSLAFCAPPNPNGSPGVTVIQQTEACNNSVITVTGNNTQVVCTPKRRTLVIND